jgi:hypothetical protein
MTKEQYFEMCEALGTEPDPLEIPIEFDDLHLEVQEAYSIYLMMQDTWDTMNGNYTGKNYSGFLDILALYEVEDTKQVFTIIKKLDEYRTKSIKMKVTDAKLNKKAAQ